MHLSPPAKHQHGVSLIEVLIAIVVIAFGLLGIAGLQTTALANNYLAYQSTQAVMLAESMVDKMRANTEGIENYLLTPGTTPSSPAKNCATAACTSSELAAWDIAQWVSMVSGGKFNNLPAGPQALMPDGKASIVCSDSPCTRESVRIITVYWDPDRTGASTYTCKADVTTDYRCYRLTYAP